MRNVGRDEAEDVSERAMTGGRSQGHKGKVSCGQEHIYSLAWEGWRRVGDMLGG